ncbi:MAG TPA: nitrous oxide reductase accessory protein NosL [Aequorivita sp.]|nr:nitrous oxide reductase accessory protein NosL [Aequorivita sp.]
MKRLFLLSLFALLLVSCEISPQKIEYGSDACAYCDMTIVDRQHAAQLVSDKGKAFKYDAIECMVHSYQENMNDTEIALYLISDFKEPGQLIDATKATYLVSEKIQSPMGANLSGFKSKEEAERTKEEFSGKTFTWEEIQKHLKH